MKLKDIADMGEYLKNRCYCPYEIYDLSGFFYNKFEPDVECEVLAEGKRGAIQGTFVLAKASRSDRLQIIYIEHDGKTVTDCTRLDATENNKSQILAFMNGEVDKMSIDEYVDTNTAENLSEILNIADAVSYAVH